MSPPVARRHCSRVFCCNRQLPALITVPWGCTRVSLLDILWSMPTGHHDDSGRALIPRRGYGFMPALVGALAVLLAGGCRQPATAPNVLLYMVDTLRADSLGCYGNEIIDTPNIDRFAREGMVFQNGFANASWTRPAVASVFTGLYPTRHRAEGRGSRLPEGMPTLGGLLTQRGYATAFIVANPNVAAFYGFGQGFSTLLEFYGRADQVTKKAIEWIEETPLPFFLAVLTIDPHFPYMAPARFDRYGAGYEGPVGGQTWELYDRDFTAAERRRILSLYYAEIAATDEAFGTLLEYLRRRDLLDDTIAIFTADHGEEFWEYGRRGHGASLAEASIRVPLVLRFPRSDRVGRGVRVTRAVQLVDIVPTVLDLVGAPVPAGLDGQPLLRPAGGSRAGSFASLMADGYKLKTIREYPWKLVWNLKADAVTLYDLSAPAQEGTPVDPDERPEAELVRRRLRGEIESIVAQAGPTAPVSSMSESDVPAAVRDALRALGYLQ